MIDYQTILDEIQHELSTCEHRGKVASYIPELAKIDTANFGMHLQLLNGKSYHTGRSKTPFSIQSISKVLTFAMAIALQNHNLWERVGVEPSGNPFNHLSLLEQEKGIPRNPFINTGALVICDILISELEHPKEAFLDFVRKLTNDPSINYNTAVAKSEQRTGFKNFAAANLLKSFGNLKNDVSEVLDFYFHQCALEINCKQLCNAFYFFANNGVCINNSTHLKDQHVKRINALMLTCGFYDEAGEFAFEVGLPGKSGVGGGIVALLPDEFVISVWSPGLNEKGNSKLGMMALEMFTTKTELSIF
ncbi:glutaminase [Sediminibacter sp. Hel_I_10]|uniref:glutaminase n=1 Tax=Sediminibacter sp. Hel_I_10 TaxID=1392490 RepID=UPI00047C96FE|nr:glutaminase [Sediminibacter sp. Hel_I_10]